MAIKKDSDIVDLTEWLTAEEAVAALVNLGVSRTSAQLYSKANKGDFTMRDIKGKRCFWAADIDEYANQLILKEARR